MSKEQYYLLESSMEILEQGKTVKWYTYCDDYSQLEAMAQMMASHGCSVVIHEKPMETKRGYCCEIPNCLPALLRKQA